MDLSIHTTPLPHTDPEASLAFYRDVLAFEVRKDVGSGEMRWITVGPRGQPGMSIRSPPAADPGITDDERRTIAEMMAKGTLGWVMLATKDLECTFERVQASGARSSTSRSSSTWGDRDSHSATRLATWSASRSCAERIANQLLQEGDEVIRPKCRITEEGHSR
jgi:predicted enzyme related to lactoylglutathione lyase